MDGREVCYAVISPDLLKGNDHNLRKHRVFLVGNFLKAKGHVAVPGTPGTFNKAQTAHKRQTLRKILTML